MSAINGRVALSESDQPSWLGLVRRQVESLRFGVVEIVVHDSRVVQIERTERVRLDKLPAGSDVTPGHSA
ncbi:MAG: YezD family protein [Verrucomicrobiota bacterium]